MTIVVVAASVAALGLAGSAPAGSAAPRCRTAQLHVHVVRTGAAAGTVGGYLAFTNRGPATCSLRGWPALTAIRAGARRTAVRVRATMFGPYLGGTGQSVRGVPTVRLRSGATAVAAFTTSDVGPGPTGACPPPFRQLRVTPPGNRASVLVSAWLPYYDNFVPSCTRIEVSMVVPVSDMPPRG